MKVIDLLSLLDDFTNVDIWEDDEIVSSYNGKDSIDPKYNDREIESFSAGYYKLDIVVKA